MLDSVGLSIIGTFGDLTSTTIPSLPETCSFAPRKYAIPPPLTDSGTYSGIVNPEFSKIFSIDSQNSSRLPIIAF